MTVNNIHQLRLVIQATKEGSFTMKGISLTNLLHNLIEDYGTCRFGTMWVDPDKFTTTEKKLLLSYFVDADEYEYASLDNANLDALYNEYQREIQILLDDECDTIYKEIMEEHGAISYRHRDNGEIAWRTI